VYLPNGQFQSLLSATEQRDVLKEIIPMVVNDLVLRNEWNFALDSASKTTVAGQAEYTLDEDQDCMQVHSVRYTASDGTFRLLEKRSQIMMDDILSVRTVDEGTYWVPLAPNKNSFQRIAVLGAPSDATHSLVYRYWKRKTLEQLPTEFENAVLAGVKSKFDTRFLDAYEHEIRVLLDDFYGEDPDAELARMDPHIARLNRRRTSKLGFGG